MQAAIVLGSICFAVLALMFAAGLRSGTPDTSRTAQKSHKRLKVVCTIAQLADAARNIGGPRIEAYALMKTGGNPHDYRARPSDLAKLSEADLVLYNGLHLEAKLGEVLDRLEDSVPTVAAAEAIPESQLLVPDESEGTYDPHVWFDVRRWMMVVECVRDALCEHDHAFAEEYRLRASEYFWLAYADSGRSRWMTT